MADAEVAVNLEPALYGCRHESWRLAVRALRRPLRGTRRCEHRIVPLKADDTVYSHGPPLASATRPIGRNQR
jgi:hypothetical protein